MKPEVIARSIAAGRLVLGTTLLAAPGLAEAWIGRSMRDARAQSMARGFAARDIALGLGVLSAKTPGELRRWMLIGAGCDAADFAAALPLKPSAARTGVVVTAAAATVAGVLAAALTRGDQA